VLSIPDIGQLDAFAEPWRQLYAHSPLLSTLILFGHLGGLFAAGGLTVAADRATLRLDPSDALDRRRHLGDLARQQRPVWIAFLVALLSGALLFLADVEAFAVSPIFWTKMALVAMLVSNAAITARLDAALRREEAAPGEARDAGAVAMRWRRRRAAAVVSAVLWFGLVLTGTALASH
jgi:diacylglycerol kinase